MKVQDAVRIKAPEGVCSCGSKGQYADEHAYDCFAFWLVYTLRAEDRDHLIEKIMVELSKTIHDQQVSASGDMRVRVQSFISLARTIADETLKARRTCVPESKEGG
jgi:hypothetical protein